MAVEGGDLKPQCEVELEGSQTGQEGGVGDGLWPPEACGWQGQGPTQEPSELSQACPWFPSWCPPQGGQSGAEILLSW